MAPTIRICSLFLATGLALSPVVAEAALPSLRSGASTFVAAEAAADAGDARRAAGLFASLAAAEPGNAMLARRALAQAMLAGDMPLALRLARSQPPQELAPDVRLLLLAEELKGRRARADRLAPLPPELASFDPFIRAWLLAERGRERAAVRLLQNLPDNNELAAYAAEHQALILLQAGRAEEGQRMLETALARAGRPARALRIAGAAALDRLGRRQQAVALLAGGDPVLARASTLLAAGRLQEQPVRTATVALSDLLLGFPYIQTDVEARPLLVGLLQVAHFADPGSGRARVMLARVLGELGRDDEALALLRGLGEHSAFVPEARQVELDLLSRSGRQQEALARARAFVAQGGGADDWARLGDVFDAMARHEPAADAYGRAAALVDAGAPGPERWALHLYRGSSLEQAGRWAEAERALETAYALAPDNPVVLNYLGYARLERGEQLEETEALIARASRLAPGDASITDSLGWAQFKQGRVEQAIETLGRAVAADPAQAEIHEHLGDALYTAGRKFEARHAWAAALVTADAEVRGRVEAKLASGLEPANAAP